MHSITIIETISKEKSCENTGKEMHLKNIFIKYQMRSFINFKIFPIFIIIKKRNEILKIINVSNSKKSSIQKKNYTK